jgi:YHS domain-containing protein
MQKAAAGITGKVGRDPVCGMSIDEDRAREEGNYLEYKGTTYFFCEPGEREEFRKNPEKYLKGPAPAMMDMSPPAPASGTKARAPVDHSSHGMMEKTAPESMKAMPHDHAAMMMKTKPKEQGAGMTMPGMTKSDMQGPAPMSGPMPGEKPGAMLPGASGNTAPVMPGPGSGTAMPDQKTGTAMPGMTMPDMQGPAPMSGPMPGEKPGAMLPGASGNTAPMMPGPGTGMAMPGMQGPASMPGEKTGAMLPGASGNTAPMMPGPGTGTAMPGTPKGTSMTQPAGNSNISPEATPGMTGPQMKETGNGHAHD